MKIKFNSIRYKFILTIVSIFLLFVSIAFGICYSYLKGKAEENAMQNMSTQINIANTSFENQVKDIINVTALTTVRSGNNLSTNIINILSQENLSDAELINYRREIDDYLISLCSFKKYLNGLTLSDFNDNSVTYGVTTPIDQLPAGSWPKDFKQNSQQNIFIAPHYFNEWNYSDNDLVFSVIRHIYDFSGNTIGFAMAEIKCQLLNETFDANVKNDMSLYLIDNNTGGIIFAPTINLLDDTTDHILDSSILEKLDSNSGDFFVAYNQEKILIVYNKSELTGWTTLSTIPAHNILDGFSHSTIKIFYIIMFLTLFMILSVFATSSLLTKNIALLTTAVKNVEIDTLNLDLEITSNDEVGALYRQFQSMLLRIKYLLKEIRLTESSKRKAELSALQSQMNPHFLYNSLNTIKFLAHLQGVANIETVSEALSSLMYTNMDGRSFLSIKEDIQFIKSYLSIQSYQFINTFHYHIAVDPGIHDYYIPKLLVQPLIENALKHGISQKQDRGTILIKYTMKDNKLFIIVKDNGVGMNDDDLDGLLVKNERRGAGHIGIYNIAERIHLYFGDESRIEIQSQLNLYTQVDVSIPFIKKEDLHNYV